MNAAQVNLWQLSKISPHGPWSTCSHLASLKLGSCCLRIRSVQSLAGETWGVRSVDARLEIPKQYNVYIYRFYWLGVFSPKIGSSPNYSCNNFLGIWLFGDARYKLLGLIRWKSRPPSSRHVSQFWWWLLGFKGNMWRLRRLILQKWLGQVQPCFHYNSNGFMIIIVDTKLHQKPGISTNNYLLFGSMVSIFKCLAKAILQVRAKRDP